MEKMIHEEEAIVLDFLPNGYSMDSRPSHMKTPIVQALGRQHFVLLELVPKKDIRLQPHEVVYIGEGKRDHIHHINGRLSPAKLTATARAELEFTVKEIIRDNQPRFVEFFNTAQPLSTRMHSLELIPGLGKKRMWEILDERKVKPFDNFEELRSRVKLIPDPVACISKRVLQEISGAEKHHLFAR